MPPADRERHFGHMVFFTLNDATSAEQQRLIDACHKYLSDHPGTLHFSTGTVADTNREVNDRDFHVALHLVFADRAAHDAYQDAERHHEFIRQHKHNWARVRVFDSDL